MRRNGRSWDEIAELAKDPRYVVVDTEERFQHGSIGRLITRKTMHNIREQCEYKEICHNCVNRQEVNCLHAWKMSVGKGIKMW